MSEVCEGCNITWEEYMESIQRANTTVRSMIYKGVIKHPHLSTEKVRFLNWTSGCYHPIYWITGPEDVNDERPNGMSRVEILQHIIDHGADVNQRDEYTHFPCMISVCDIEVFDVLLRNGVDLTATTSTGNNILHVSVSRGYFDFIRHICSAESIRDLIHSRNDSEKTPYDLMRENDHEMHPDIAAFLKDGVISGRNTKRAR